MIKKRWTSWLSSVTLCSFSISHSIWLLHIEHILFMRLNSSQHNKTMEWTRSHTQLLPSNRARTLKVLKNELPPSWSYNIVSFKTFHSWTHGCWHLRMQFIVSISREKKPKTFISKANKKWNRFKQRQRRRLAFHLVNWNIHFDSARWQKMWSVSYIICFSFVEWRYLLLFGVILCTVIFLFFLAPFVYNFSLNFDVPLSRYTLFFFSNFQYKTPFVFHFFHFFVYTFFSHARV